MLSESDILNLVDEAVEFGVNAINGKKNVLALQIGAFWLEGYIEGRKNEITEADKKSLRATMNRYCFI